MERLDVRVPDAAADHADVRRHDPRRDVPRRRASTDSLWQGARGALGHLRIGLQQDRRPPQLSVQGVRCPRPRVQARPRRRSRRGSLRQRHGADGRARGRVRQHPNAHACRRRWRVWPLRGRRLHGVSAATGKDQRDRAIVHVAPPRDGIPVARLRAAGPPDAASLRRGAGIPGDGAAASGEGATCSDGRAPRGGKLDDERAAGRRPRATFGFSRPRTRHRPRCTCCPTAAITSPSRTQAVVTAGGATSRSRAGERTARATTGARSATSAKRAANASGPSRISLHSGRPEATKRSSRRGAPSSAAGIATFSCTRRSAFLPRTTSRSVA